jgi:hypothetical protein
VVDGFGKSARIPQGRQNRVDLKQNLAHLGW